MRSLGATHVVDRHVPLADLPAAVAAITSKPLTIVYDSIAHPDTQQAGYDLLAPEGTLVIVNIVQVSREDAQSKKAIIPILASIHGDVNRQIGEELYQHLESLLDQEEIKVRRRHRTALIAMPIVSLNVLGIRTCL